MILIGLLKDEEAQSLFAKTSERFDQANTRISSNSFIKLSYKLDTKYISDNFVASHIIYEVHNKIL